MHYYLSEEGAEEVIAIWLRIHHNHEGASVLQRQVTVELECPVCGPGVFQSITKRDGRYERFARGDKSLERVWVY
jgi:hypothetical protein